MCRNARLAISGKKVFSFVLLFSFLHASASRFALSIAAVAVLQYGAALRWMKIKAKELRQRGTCSSERLELSEAVPTVPWNVSCETHGG